MTRRPGWSRRNLVLPLDTYIVLHDLYQKARQDGPDSRASELFDGYLAKLRQVGWSLRSIGAAVGITGERVRQRVLDATEAAFSSNELPDAPPLPPLPLKLGKVRKPKARMREDFKQWLRETHKVARECRGWHELGSPERVASDEFWAAVDRALAQGIHAPAIAKAIDVQVGTIWAGLRRRGYRKKPPSQRPYLGIVLDRSKPGPRPGAWREFCKHGHALTGENVFIYRGQRHGCKECIRRRAREKYRAKVALAAAEQAEEQAS